MRDDWPASAGASARLGVQKKPPRIQWIRHPRAWHPDVAPSGGHARSVTPTLLRRVIGAKDGETPSIFCFVNKTNLSSILTGITEDTHLNWTGTDDDRVEELVDLKAEIRLVDLGMYGPKPVKTAAKLIDTVLNIAKTSGDPCFELFDAPLRPQYNKFPFQKVRKILPKLNLGDETIKKVKELVNSIESKFKALDERTPPLNMSERDASVEGIINTELRKYGVTQPLDELDLNQDKVPGTFGFQIEQHNRSEQELYKASARFHKIFALGSTTGRSLI